LIHYGFSFQPTHRHPAGLKLNLSGGGVSLSAGVPGAHINAFVAQMKRLEIGRLGA
jgi:hypothetical protein